MSSFRRNIKKNRRSRSIRRSMKPDEDMFDSEIDPNEEDKKSHYSKEEFLRELQMKKRKE